MTPEDHGQATDDRRRSNDRSEHRPPEFIERRVCGECGIIPPFCDHDRARQIVERYVPESESAVLEEALAMAVRNGEARDPEAAVAWFKDKARERLERGR